MLFKEAIYFRYLFFQGLTHREVTNMAGAMCPMCGKQTFYKSPLGRTCSKCGYKMIVPPNSGKGGQGKKCHNCGKNTVFNNKCTNCGAYYEK